ncbi:MAG: rhodanese-like domain-containing protein [Eubacteriales bacterium]|nr:rhodanese-like domain-containing protein [Eubacteriales bacterium]
MMKKHSVFILATVIVLALLVVGCAPISAPTYVDLSPKEAKELIDRTPDLVIIDVSPKYDEGHIPGAINYYLGDGSLDAAIPTLDKTKTYLVYCHVDSVSIAGASKLIEAGFENVYRLEGNYSAWVEAGYPVEK